MSAPPADDLPQLAFASRRDWWEWLAAHHGDARGIWLKFAKKGSGIPTVTYDEAVEVALCFGWIDGQARGLDGSYHLQRFTPRRARSRWSMINRDRALALIESGEMQPEGLAEVERARADGRWEAAYAGPATATVPDDLAVALDAAGLRAAFDALKSAERYSILYGVGEAKRPDTRGRRIEKFVAMLAEATRPDG